MEGEKDNESQADDLPAEIDPQDGQPEEADHQRVMLALIIPTLLLVVIGLVIGIFRVQSLHAPMPAADAPVVSTPIGENPLDGTAYSVPLPFGNLARTECRSKCASLNAAGEACRRTCDRLTVAEYPRAPRTKDLDGTAVAEKIAADCELASPRSGGDDDPDWKGRSLEALSFFVQSPPQTPVYELDSLAAQFAKLEELRHSVQAPQGAAPNEAKFVKSLQAATCTREALVAAQLGVFAAASASDIVGERFYRKLEEALLTFTKQREASANELTPTVFPKE